MNLNNVLVTHRKLIFEGEVKAEFSMDYKVYNLISYINGIMLIKITKKIAISLRFTSIASTSYLFGEITSFIQYFFF